MKSFIYKTLGINIILMIIGFFSTISVNGSIQLSEETYTIIWILLTAIGAVGIIVGLSVIGSGLNETSSKMVLMLLFYLVIWFGFSIYSYELLILIPSGIGQVFYWVLFIVYAVGVAWIFAMGGSE